MTITCPQLGHQGRLGNQLYQLAATIGIGRVVGQPVCLPDDWDYREHFSVPAEFFGNCGGTPATDYAGHIDERARAYLQDLGFFSAILPELREYLAPSRLARETLAQYEEYHALKRPVLAVHVRRGDNVPGADPGHPVNKHLWHPCPPLSYYMAAIEQMRQDRGAWGSLAVFGDDPEWNKRCIPADYYDVGIVRAKEHLPEYHTEPALDWISWFLLSEADEFVLSNSTFGIFAAIIAGGPAIVPTPFFGPELDYVDSSLLHPPSWKKVPY